VIEVNLLPGGQRKVRGSGPRLSLAGMRGLGDAVRNRYVAGGVAAVAVAILAVVGMYSYQSHVATRVNAREAAAARDSSRFWAVLATRRQAETARDSVYSQLAIIKSIDDSRFVWPHVLEAINLALPAYTWLTDVEQTSAVVSSAAPLTDSARAAAGAKKPARKPDAATLAREVRMHSDSLFNGTAELVKFRIVGQTVDIQALTQFMKALEASPFIQNVQLSRSDLVMNDNKQVTEFQLEAQTSVPPAHVLQTVPLSIAVQ